MAKKVEQSKETIVKTTKEHTIIKKRSGRFAVQNAAGVFLKAQEKVDVLLAAKLIKLTPAKKKEAPAAEAAPVPVEVKTDETAAS